MQTSGKKKQVRFLIWTLIKIENIPLIRNVQNLCVFFFKFTWPNVAYCGPSSLIIPISYSIMFITWTSIEVYQIL